MLSAGISQDTLSECGERGETVGGVMNTGAVSDNHNSSKKKKKDDECCIYRFANRIHTFILISEIPHSLPNILMLDKQSIYWGL